MTLVRGILLGLVTSLALAGAPAQAAAPAPSAAPTETARAGASWDVLKSWKGGKLRACRGKWDGDSFRARIQMVNGAERGLRGAVLGVRVVGQGDWSAQDYSPIAAGTKSDYVDSDTALRPGKIKIRAKVTKGEKKSGWGKVIRMDNLPIC